MPQYRVYFHVDATGSIVVNAATPAAAKRKAEEEFSPDSENTELGDLVKIVDCMRLDQPKKGQRRANR